MASFLDILGGSISGAGEVAEQQRQEKKLDEQKARDRLYKLLPLLPEGSLERQRAVDLIMGDEAYSGVFDEQPKEPDVLTELPKNGLDQRVPVRDIMAGIKGFSNVQAQLAKLPPDDFLGRGDILDKAHRSGELTNEQYARLMDKLKSDIASRPPLPPVSFYERPLPPPAVTEHIQKSPIGFEDLRKEAIVMLKEDQPSLGGMRELLDQLIRYNSGNTQHRTIQALQQRIDQEEKRLDIATKLKETQLERYKRALEKEQQDEDYYPQTDTSDDDADADDAAADADADDDAAAADAAVSAISLGITPGSTPSEIAEIILKQANSEEEVDASLWSLHRSGIHKREVVSEVKKIIDKKRLERLESEQYFKDNPHLEQYLNKR
jgi:hypothetical protein